MLITERGLSFEVLSEVVQDVNILILPSAARSTSGIYPRHIPLMLRLDVLYHFGCHLGGINLHAGEDST